MGVRVGQDSLRGRYSVSQSQRNVLVFRVCASPLLLSHMEDKGSHGDPHNRQPLTLTGGKRFHVFNLTPFARLHRGRRASILCPFYR